MKLKPKIHQLPELLLITAVFLLMVFLPSYFDDSLMNGTQSGKFFFFGYALMGILVLWAVWLFTKKVSGYPPSLKLLMAGRFQVTGIDLLLVLFVAWVSLNKYFLHDVHALSLRYFELLGLLVLYIIIRTLNSKFYIFLLLAICVGGTIQAVYGNLQLWGYYPSHHGLFKISGSFFNPGPYAGYLCCILPIALGLYWSHKDYKFQVSSFKKLISSFRFQVSGSLWSKLRFKYVTSDLNGSRTIHDGNLNGEAQPATSNLKPETSNLNRNEVIRDDYREGEAQPVTCNLQPETSIEPETSNLQPIFFKYTALATIVAILLVLPAARSRAAWLGAFAGVAFLAWHRYNIGGLFKHRTFLNLNLNLSSRFRKWIILSILAILVVSSGIGLYHYKKESADGRMLIWTVTANIIKDYPLLGVGQDLFKAHYMNYQADYFRNHPDSKYETVADDNQYAFNEPLNIWAENGIIGLLLAGGIVFAIFNFRFQVSSSSWSKLNVKPKNSNLNQLSAICDGDMDDEAQPATFLPTVALAKEGNLKPATCNLEPETILRSSLLAVLIFGLFAYPSEILPIKMIAILCLGILSNLVSANKLTYNEVQPVTSNLKPVNYHLNRNEEEIGEAKPVTCNLKLATPNLKLVIALFTLLLAVAAFTKANELRHAYTTWKDAFQLYNYGLYTECLDDYQKALPLLQHNGEFMIKYGKALSIAEKNEEAIEILEVAKNYQTNTVLFIAMGESYKVLDNYLMAEENYYKASKMVSSKILPLYLLAKLYDESNQQVKAKEMATSLLNKEIKVESLAIEEMKDKMKKIITKNDREVGSSVNNLIEQVN